MDINCNLRPWSRMNGMVSIVTKWIVMSLLIFQMHPLVAQTWSNTSYEGYRCSILNAHSFKNQGNSITFTCDIANTGRQEIVLKTKRTGGVIVFQHDGTLSDTLISEHGAALMAAFLQTGIKLSPGAMVRQRQVIMKKGATVVVPEIPASEEELNETSVEYFDQVDGRDCPDLVIEQAHTLKKKKHLIEVEVAITNQGDAPARIYYPTRKGEGMSITWFLSNTPGISRSSQLVKGEIITSGLDETRGWLWPGEILQWKTSIPLEKEQAYRHTLHVRLDNFQFVEECDSTNNEYAHPIATSTSEVPSESESDQ